MLISLTKILLFILVIVLIATVLTNLMDSKSIVSGEIQTIIAGTEFILTPLHIILFLLCFSIAAWLMIKILALIFSILKFINGDETAVTRFFYRKRERKGYQALSDGMLALASGEGQVAMDKAKKAARFLNNPSLTNLLAAQAAELSGYRSKAADIYKDLVLSPETRFVGVLGLLKHKIEDGNTEVALRLAERAFLIKPKNGQIQDTLLQLQAKTKDWDGARQTLRAKLKHGNLPRDVHKRRDAILALSQAKVVSEDGEFGETHERAIESNRLSPDLVPAATMAARAYIKQGKPKYATRVIKKAWEAQPHPDLAIVFLEIVPNETPSQRLKRFQTLASLAPSHRETKLTKAELFLAAEEFNKARNEIEVFLEDDPDVRTFTIMAAVEKGRCGSDELVRGWLTKALSAQRGPQWICDRCSTTHAEWTAVCESCKAFDTLSWKSLQMTNMSSSTGLEMLQLLVGQSDTKESSNPIVKTLDEKKIFKDGKF